MADWSLSQKRHDLGIMNCIILQLVIDSTNGYTKYEKNKKNNIYLDMWKKSTTFALAIKKKRSFKTLELN